MIKSKSGDTWTIIQPKIMTNTTKKIANNTVNSYKLVKDKTTNTWKLVAPKVVPTSKLIKKHFIRIGN